MTDYAALLRGRITLTCRSIDRVFLQAYVPNLQTPGLVARFLLGRGYPYPSSVALGKIDDAYVASRAWSRLQRTLDQFIEDGVYAA